MSKIAVVYWSGTGNTEAMANAINIGAKEAGADVTLFEVTQITSDQAAGYEKLILGCSSMGAEVLEEIDFEPFFTDLEGKISGKKIALFGSYGWGDGEWMRDWQGRVERSGANLFEEGLIINDMPDAVGIESCEAFAKRFVAY